MGVLTRYKKDPDGFRKFVELLESTPQVRRQKMIDVSQAEDPEYTRAAMALMLNFQDILALPEMEMAELVAVAQPRTTAMALYQADADTRAKFVRCAKPHVGAEIRDYLDTPNVPLREVGGAQLKLIEVARSLEHKGLIKTKRIVAPE